MAFRDPAMNTAKYGAHSTASGRVSVRWRLGAGLWRGRVDGGMAGARRPARVAAHTPRFRLAARRTGSGERSGRLDGADLRPDGRSLQDQCARSSVRRVRSDSSPGDEVLRTEKEYFDIQHSMNDLTERTDATMRRPVLRENCAQSIQKVLVILRLQTAPVSTPRQRWQRQRRR